jgi:CBS domain containing-hemolysin-like protein
MPPEPAHVLAVTMTQVDWWMLVTVIVLFVMSIALAVAETALTRTSLAKAQALAEGGGKRARTLLRLVEHQEWLNPLLLVVLTAQVVQSTLLGVLATRVFGGAVGIVLVTLVNVTVFFVFAEVAPKTWAIQHTERAALFAARPVRALADFTPLRVVSRGLIGLTNVILPGKGLKRGPFVSEAELLAVADLAVEEDVIEAGERDLIESIIEFGDTVVREVMVPRPDMVTVQSDFRVGDVLEIVLLNGYSRLPVLAEGIDDVVGIVYAKDLMRAQRDDKDDLPVRELTRPARFVPETKRVPALLAEMQREKFHMAVVVDEYGGTAGLVTLEDLIEELVGEIVDEFDVEDPTVEPLPGGDIRVNARISVDEVNDLIHARLPEKGDWDSIGGLLLSELGRVPTEGESVDVDGWRLTAQRVQGRRIGRVQLNRIQRGDRGRGGDDES